MKIITLHQPWASLMMLGLKRFETRTWGTKYTGPLVIHAAKKPFVKADGSEIIEQSYWLSWLDALEIAAQLGAINEKTEMPLAQKLPLGKILGVCNLDGCFEMSDNRFRLSGKIRITEQNELERRVGDWSAGNIAWKCSMFQALETPVDWTGAQGLRDLPPEMIRQINEAPTKYVAPKVVPF